MATLTFVEILKEQKHYHEALHVFSMVDSKSNWKSSFVNNATESTINGLTVTQRQSLSDALKPKADN